MSNIRNQVMLGRLSFRGWAGEIKDKSSSRKIEQDAGAVEGASKAKKVLLPGVAELEAIQKYAAGCRTWWHGISVPWEDGGARAYSAARHFEIQTDMGDRMRQYDQLVADFVLKYPTLYAEQQFRLNHLFDPADYPAPSEIADKFGMYFTVRPIPNSEDLRVIEGLTTQEVERLVAEAKAGEQEQIAQAVGNAYEKLYKVVKAMADKLAVPVGEKGSVFRDSLIENIRELANVMPGLNITHDPKLDDLTQKALVLTQYSPDDLKTPGPRAEAQKKAAALAELFGKTTVPAKAAAAAPATPALDTVMAEYDEPTVGPVGPVGPTVGPVDEPEEPVSDAKTLIGGIDWDD